MKRMAMAGVMLVAWCASAAHAADTASGMALVAARPVAAEKVAATGRVEALVSARVSPRVAGHIMALGRDSQGRTLDAGMQVKKGDVLFCLNETTFRNNEAAAAAALVSAQAALEHLKAPTRPERIDELHAGVRELEARLAEKKKDEERFVRLVETEKTMPAKRLEEVRMEVTVIEAQLQASKARLAQSEHGATKTEIAMSDARVKEAQVALATARDELRDATVRAPFDGVVTRRMKGVGDYVAANPPVEVFEVISLASLEAEVRLPESYYSRVTAGETRAKLTSNLLKAPLDLTVTRVVNFIDPARGTFACRIAVPAGAAGLAPGAFVTAEVELGDGDGQTIVPSRAVHREEEKSYVYVAAGATMTRREIVPGEKLTEGMMVRRGVKTGELIVVGPAGSLKDGAALPTDVKRE